MKANYTRIGLDLLEKGIHHKDQLSLLRSLDGANRYRKLGKHSQSFLMNRANLSSSHYHRAINNLEEILGAEGYEYSKEEKIVTKAWSLYEGKGQWVQIPSKWVGQLNSNDLLTFFYLTTILSHKKASSYSSSVSQLVRSANTYFEKKGMKLKLDLSTTYYSIRKLKALKLINFEKKIWGVKTQNNKKLYFNYITNISISKEAWNEKVSIQDIIKEIEVINVSTNSSYDVSIKPPLVLEEKQVAELEANTEDWDPIINIL